MPSTEPRHFTRDKSLSADVADAFGGGAGIAENLVEAVQMSYTQELVAAQLLPEDEEGTAELEHSEVAGAGGVDEDALVAFGRHGDYVIYSFQTPDERIHKDVLVLRKDGSLESPHGEDSPHRAAIRAQVEAAGKVKDARSEAEEIIRKAQEEADRIVAEAAQKAEENRAESVKAAAEGDPSPPDEEPKRKPGGKPGGKSGDKN